MFCLFFFSLKHWDNITYFNINHTLTGLNIRTDNLLYSYIYLLLFFRSITHLPIYIITSLSILIDARNYFHFFQVYFSPRIIMHFYLLFFVLILIFLDCFFKKKLILCCLLALKILFTFISIKTISFLYLIYYTVLNW